MKINSLIVSVICLFFLAACNTKSKNQELKSEMATDSVQNTKDQLRHLVLFKFNDNVSTDSIRIVQEAFSALPAKIPEIRDFEWGLDISVEDLHQDFTHAFLVTFGSVEDRSRYLPHPDHQEFVKMLTPMLEDVLVIDYWAKE